MKLLWKESDSLACSGQDYLQQLSRVSDRDLSQHQRERPESISKVVTLHLSHLRANCCILCFKGAPGGIQSYYLLYSYNSPVRQTMPRAKQVAQVPNPIRITSNLQNFYTPFSRLQVYTAISMRKIVINTTLIGACMGRKVMP